LGEQISDLPSGAEGQIESFFKRACPNSSTTGTPEEDVLSHQECACNEIESSEHGVNQGWIRWLDRRNEMRAAWIVLSGQGALPEQKGLKLARNVHELRQLTKEGGYPEIVRTKDELWKLVEKGLGEHPLGRLSPYVLEKFISGVQFVDYKRDGERHKHVGVFYYGDLRRAGFTYAEMFEVYALFGMSAEFAVRSSDKFGWDVDNELCQPRPNYNCPWDSDC
jgi:hypothetical protein